MFSENRINELIDALHDGDYDHSLVVDVCQNFAVNDEQTYNAVVPIVENLQNHGKRGEYDDTKAINSFARIGGVALKNYLAWIFCRTPWHEFCSMETRVAIGREITRLLWEY